jgi:hypothetical protein
VAVAQREAREAALALGANTVVLDQHVVRLPAGRSYVSGDALHCRAPATATPAPTVVPAHALSAPAPANALPGISAVEPTAPAPSAAQPAAAPAAPAAASVEERLRTLQDLREKGLITQEEYDARRQEILQEI